MVLTLLYQSRFLQLRIWSIFQIYKIYTLQIQAFRTYLAPQSCRLFASFSPLYITDAFQGFVELHLLFIGIGRFEKKVFQCQLVLASCKKNKCKAGFPGLRLLRQLRKSRRVSAHV